MGGGTSLPPQKNNIKLLSADKDVTAADLAQVIINTIRCMNEILTIF